MNVGDIIICDFPFTDKPNVSKVRPALVVASTDEFVWCLFVGKSESRGCYSEHIYEFSNNDTDFKFPEISCVRMDIINTIHKKQIIKKMGSCHTDCFEIISEHIRKLIPENLNN